MKISETWLREWVKPSLTREQLCEKLTLSGLEIESLTPVVEKFSGVVVAKVLKVDKHPEADRLKICEVDVGEKEPLMIVCGASNVSAGMKVPAALVGAELANDFKISRSKIRGVVSNGMLCSAKELGLAEQSEGLLPLPNDAPIGENFWDYYDLNDYVIDISITPNRGDCLSVMGLAKEISALTETVLQMPSFSTIKPTIKDTLPVKTDAATECPRYVGRVIKNVKADAETPIWMKERLRRSGQRCISPVVDVMNFVMLEMGQPMHAFDLDKISGEIVVRLAKSKEKLALLDGQTVELHHDTLVIADQNQPVAIAGVMGGLDSSVTLLTKNIFLESAYFKPQIVARAGRKYILNSESSYRFERGIDPTLQVDAIERATELLLEITGGEVGPVIEVKNAAQLPQPVTISLQKEKISRLLGMNISDENITNILQRLGMNCEKNTAGWKVTVPARRSDITLDVDLIEEIIRVYGYEKIPTQLSQAKLQIHPRSESQTSLTTLKNTLCDLGYNEVITYSFIDTKLQKMFDPDQAAKELLNPMTAEMSVMRTNLWPGLISALLYNLNRQQNRLRIFETGLRFIKHEQQRVLSGLVYGSVFPEQWGIAQRSADFFDLKGDLEQLFRMTNAFEEFSFKKAQHPALHPGQTAEIFRHEKSIGWIGAVHPSIIQSLDIRDKVFVFEIDQNALESARIARGAEISKFPEIRRDIAIIVDQTVPAQAISDTIRNVAGELLKELNVFDMYQGKGINPDQKSIAFSLTLQHTSRTLVDEEVAELMERVIATLKDKFAAVLR